MLDEGDGETKDSGERWMISLMIKFAVVRTTAIFDFGGNLGIGTLTDLLLTLCLDQKKKKKVFSGSEKQKGFD